MISQNEALTAADVIRTFANEHPDAVVPPVVVEPPPVPLPMSLYNPLLQTIQTYASVKRGEVLKNKEVRAAWNASSAYPYPFSVVDCVEQGIPRADWPEYRNLRINGLRGAQGLYTNQGEAYGLLIDNYGQQFPDGRGGMGIYAKQLYAEHIRWGTKLNSKPYDMQIRATDPLAAGSPYGGLLWWDITDAVNDDEASKFNLGGGICGVEAGILRECSFAGMVIVGDLSGQVKHTKSGTVTFDGGSYGTLDIRYAGPIKFAGGVEAATVIKNGRTVDLAGLRADRVV